MKCISIWQPHASAIALGAKRIETRSWATKYRGPIAIHAAKRCVKSELAMYHLRPEWRGALNIGPFDPEEDHLCDILPFGAIIAVGVLKDCVPIRLLLADPDTITREHHRDRDWDPTYVFRWTEALMGNYTTSRFGWILEDVVALPAPVPFIGRQGLFTVPDYHYLLAGDECCER